MQSNPKGNSREFTPYTVNAMRSKIEQEVVVAFSKKEISTYVNTDITTERVTTPDGCWCKNFEVYEKALLHTNLIKRDDLFE